eukprot:CAMPEP_0206271028 /NCGR_PEP_ID=MMETSP0047_2-20121206/33198_1 /ASSEMBLY_ACC=CAM_ASM_000192 /TAXON_ID=195065 /ORGANISM="Chroomonas mesostigmatica_cf, Strain CCMP1168" /LENGTH=143 /DNA_ID=CAMNT_0053699739 /DNA_START=191 /DNA_END=619 /DNA_ORIENTATION=-
MVGLLGFLAEESKAHAVEVLLKTPSRILLLLAVRFEGRFLALATASSILYVLGDIIISTNVYTDSIFKSESGDVRNQPIAGVLAVVVFASLQVFKWKLKKERAGLIKADKEKYDRLSAEEVANDASNGRIEHLAKVVKMLGLD